MDFDPGTRTQPPTGAFVILIFIPYIIYSEKELFNHFKNTKYTFSPIRSHIAALLSKQLKISVCILHDFAGAAGDPSEASKQFRRQLKLSEYRMEAVSVAAYEK
jgi:hypothetical protein